VIENDLLDELIANGLSTCYYLATYKRKSWEILKIYDSQPLFRDRPPSVPTSDSGETINIKRYEENWRSLANYYDCF